MGGGPGAGEDLRASMRPRHKAAENCDAIYGYGQCRNASMRPRHKAAENAATTTALTRPPACFNEAAT